MKSIWDTEIIFTLRETQDENGVDCDKAQKIAGDHSVDHNYERPDDLDAPNK